MNDEEWQELIGKLDDRRERAEEFLRKLPSFHFYLEAENGEEDESSLPPEADAYEPVLKLVKEELGPDLDEPVFELVKEEPEPDLDEPAFEMVKKEEPESELDEPMLDPAREELEPDLDEPVLEPVKEELEPIGEELEPIEPVEDLVQPEPPDANEEADPPPTKPSREEPPRAKDERMEDPEDRATEFPEENGKGGDEEMNEHDKKLVKSISRFIEIDAAAEAQIQIWQGSPDLEQICSGQYEILQREGEEALTSIMELLQSDPLSSTGLAALSHFALRIISDLQTYVEREVGAGTRSRHFEIIKRVLGCVKENSLHLGRVSGKNAGASSSEKAPAKGKGSAEENGDGTKVSGEKVAVPA